MMQLGLFCVSRCCCRDNMSSDVTQQHLVRAQLVCVTSAASPHKHRLLTFELRNWENSSNHHVVQPEEPERQRDVSRVLLFSTSSPFISIIMFLKSLKLNLLKPAAAHELPAVLFTDSKESSFLLTSRRFVRFSKSSSTRLFVSDLNRCRAIGTNNSVTLNRSEGGGGVVCTQMACVCVCVCLCVCVYPSIVAL